MGRVRPAVLSGAGRLLVGALALLPSAACADHSPPSSSRSARAPVRPESSAKAAAPAWIPPDDGAWTRPAKDFASTRYSPLSDITTANVGTLQPAFTFSTGVERGEEGVPIVVGSTMYLVTPYPDVVFALDLRRPDSGPLWTYRPIVAPAAQGEACCDVVNRGLAFDGGRIFLDTLDGHVIALDAASGRELWNATVGDLRRGETLTAAPLVVDGKVLVGNSGGEFGARGWLTALDAATGRPVWKAWSTGPDRDVLIGARFRPFYASDRGADLGVATWPPDAWRIGGGTAGGWISYDPELRLVYYGTSSAAPGNPDQRPGDNKWTASVFARDPGTGDAVWAYQWDPHGLFGWDGTNENVLLDLPWNGSVRKVLVHPDRNGYVYALDRRTGEMLSAEPFVEVTTTAGVDRKTGRPIALDEKRPQIGRVVRDVCPASPGGKNWQPSAFSPRTGLVYIPHENLCQDVEAIEANYIEGTPYLGANVRMYAGPGGVRGAFTAWDPVPARPVWSVPERFPVWSGALATAGDVVFYGTMDGWFKALDARTGALLWKYRTDSGIVGQPVTYRGPDRRQYVAVLSGVGGWAGLVVSGDVDARDATAAFGFAHAMTDLPQATRKGGKLYAFALP